MKKRFRVKHVGGTYVLHVQKLARGRKVFRRLWGYEFPTESMARKFAEGNF